MSRLWDVIAEIEHLSPDRLEFENRPVYRSPEEYQAAIQSVVDLLAPHPQVAAIYQIGDVSTPGISDIDLVIVFQDDMSSPFSPPVRLGRELDRYLFMHGLFGMPAQVFRRRGLLIPMKGLTRLHGEEIAADEGVDGEAACAVKSVYAVEYLIANIFNLAGQFWTRRLKVRNLLCSLNGLRYDFDILAQFFKDESWKHFCEQLTCVRRHWFENEGDALMTFFSLCRRALQLSMQLLAGMLDAGAPPICVLADSRVGASGYLRVAQATLAGAKLWGRESEWRWVADGVLALPMPRFLKKQVTDLREALVAIVLTLTHPPAPDTASPSLAETILGLEMRNQLLADYARFMQEHIDREFAQFDVLRWSNTRSRKWNAIRSANRILAGRRV